MAKYSSFSQKVKIKLKPLSNELKKKIYEGFTQYAIAMTGHDEKFDSVAIVANSEEGSFAGAIVVELFWGALHIKDVYVKDEFRNLGIATQLMEKALE